MNIPEILPCPWCGKQPRWLTDGGGYDGAERKYLVCVNSFECPGFVPQSIEAWNRRQPTPEAAAAESRRCVWLLERRLWNKPESPVVYFRQREPYLFTVNPNEALQFATKEEAEAVRISYENEPGHRPHYYHYEVHEHIFLDAAHPPKPEPTEAPSGFVMVPRERLLYWTEYWNGNHNERAMADALDNIIPDIASYLSVAAPKPPAGSTPISEIAAEAERTHPQEMADARQWVKDAFKPPAEWMEAAAKEIVEHLHMSEASFKSLSAWTGAKHAQVIEAIIKQHAPKVPEGWQMVPVEPTESMIAYGTKAETDSYSPHTRHIWKAMLAATPKEPK